MQRNGMDYIYISHVSEYPKIVYRLFATLSYAKSLKNLQKRKKMINWQSEQAEIRRVLNCSMFTYGGASFKKNANWGNGRSRYSMIFRTASDFIYDLQQNRRSWSWDIIPQVWKKKTNWIACDMYKQVGSYTNSWSIVSDAWRRWTKTHHLSFSTRTTLEMSSGARPDLCNSFFPDSLCSGSNLICLHTEQNWWLLKLEMKVNFIHITRTTSFYTNFFHHYDQINNSRAFID